MRKKIIRKICLIGDESVGKTSLVRRYVEDSFSEDYKSTLGVSLSKKIIVSEDSEIILMVWDLEGNRDPQRFPEDYIEGAFAAFAVADLTRKETLQKACEFSKSFLQLNSSGQCFLALNKLDLCPPEVSESLQDGVTRCQEKSPLFSKIVSVSAKSGDGVQNLFALAAGARS